MTDREMTEMATVYIPVPSGKVLKKLDGRVYECTHIKCYPHYKVGGHSLFSGDNFERGYYISVVPVKKGEHFEEFMAFSGVCKLMVPCSRRGGRAERSALAVFNAEKDTFWKEVYDEVV